MRCIMCPSNKPAPGELNTKINVDGKDVTPVTRRTVKKALVIVDEYYLHNFFNKEEITKKMEDYLKNPKK